MKKKYIPSSSSSSSSSSSRNGEHTLDIFAEFLTSNIYISGFN
jgi:hypothetical protein